jgi:hypothetical protein
LGRLVAFATGLFMNHSVLISYYINVNDMKSKLNLLFLVGGLALLASCSSQLKVTSDYDKSVDFSGYKTFALYPLQDKSGAVSQLNQNRISEAVKKQMLAKGFTENDASPDVLVNVVTYLKEKQEVTANTNYYGYGGYYRPYAWGGGMASGTTTYSTYNYHDGTLMIDVVDAAKKQLIWQGVGNKEIDKPTKDPDEKINAAVAKIMAAFPPGAKK